jgi:ABC-type proline/glycine betaine transport system ATPase subunit
LLILDEATSALDNKSEQEVQKALDIVSKGITTIAIAHKVETIQNSDNIIFIKDGNIAEMGSHEELLANRANYYNMVMTQAEKQKKEQREKEEREREEMARESISKIYEDELENLNDDEEELKEDGKIEQSHEADVRSPSKRSVTNYNNKKGSVAKEDIVLQDMVNNENLYHNKRMSTILERRETFDKRAMMTPLTERKQSGLLNVNTEHAFKRLDSEIKKTEHKETITTTEEDAAKIENKKFNDLRKRLLSLLKDHKLFVVGASIAASCNGAVWPIYGILLADAIGTLADKDHEAVQQGGLNIAMMFMALAITAGTILWMQK